MSTRRPPRKPRGQGPQNSSRASQQAPQSQTQHQTQHQGGFITSDYESDIPAHLDQQAAEQALPDPDISPSFLRTNEEMNLKVLRRYLPGIISVPRVINHAHVYFYSSTEQKWETTAVSGSTFLLEVSRDQPDDSQAESRPHQSSSRLRPRQCLFLLNRKSLNNIVLDLGLVRMIEFEDQILIVTTESHDALMGTYTTSASASENPGGGEITFGLYIYENANLYQGNGCPGDKYRQEEVDFITERWIMAREDRVLELELERLRQEEEANGSAPGLSGQTLYGTVDGPENAQVSGSQSQYYQNQYPGAEQYNYGPGVASTTTPPTPPNDFPPQASRPHPLHPQDANPSTGAANGPAMQALGRKLSLSELFGGGAGAGGSGGGKAFS